MDRTIVIAAMVLVALVLGGPPAASAGESDPRKVRAQNIAQELLSLRSNLARTFISDETEVTEDTFQRVCAPVGARAKEIVAAEGVVIRQAATKHRNPKNAATPSETPVLLEFLNNPNKRDHWDRIQMDGKTYDRYMRRIDVEEACLKCHGSKESRPEFIAKKYPDDRAVDFRVGDLRGAIVVMVPAD